MVIKKFFVFLLLLVNIQLFASFQKKIEFSDIQNIASSTMLQSDGSLIFDGKKDYLKINNPAVYSESMAIYMKFKLTSSSFFDKTLELINTADGEVESGSSKALWGLSVNYTREGLWIVSYDKMQGEMTHNFTKFRFIPGTLYELYIYLDSKNIRIYVDGKCISEKRLPYGYYYNARNLYVGAGVLKDSYSAMQVYDFDVFTGIQTAKESEKLTLKGNVLLDNKSVFSMGDLKPFVRSKQDLRENTEIKSGDSVTLVNPLVQSSSVGFYFDFTFHEKTQTLKNTLEFFNTANTMPEIMGLWGISLNYDKNGLSLLTRNNQTNTIKTGVFFRENERYSMFVYIDSCDVYIYVNGKCVKRSVNTTGFYKNTTYLHIGAGVLVNSYVPMTLHDFKLTNKVLENKKEVDELLVALMTNKDEIQKDVIVKENKKNDFSLKIYNRENYVLAGAIASYAVSATAFAFIPVCLGIYGYNNFIYQESSSRYHKAMYQEELDLYYKNMQQSSFCANTALTAGIVLIPVCAATLTSGIILTVIYQKLKMEHLPKVAFGFVPNQGCLIQFSVPFTFKG